MKKYLLCLSLLGFSTPAFASVCILQTASNSDVISDSVVSMICDGRTVAHGGSATAMLDRYLANGYRISGQSSTDASIIYTLVK